MCVSVCLSLLPLLLLFLLNSIFFSLTFSLFHSLRYVVNGNAIEIGVRVYSRCEFALQLGESIISEIGF